MKRICVFTGSYPGAGSGYLSAVQELAQELVSRHWGLVYGGSKLGLMGAMADAVLTLGGHVTGVIPQSLVDRELVHSQLSQLRTVQSMHERKARMAELSSGFVALPGGLGTLEEIFEVFTWAQLGLHDKPCALLNVDGYYDRLLGFLDHVVEQRFLKDVHRAMLMVEATPKLLLDRFEHYEAPQVDKYE
ncbi:TIGR00730 family Rossman fold protein [Candidatus Entotheonella palauensis]|uniref:LOG family protein n=1 Tax=Candidatus Entotheonella palauensis TaxID=93172 RepID=UPI000B7DC6EC|nr:TIGR00730 family Rossman fold protein [Candidatus Entotheonella palauensis]